MAIPLLEAIDLQGKDISADARADSKQRELARYLVEVRRAHYHFIIKGNQGRLLEDITLYFRTRQLSDAVSVDGERGRIETRKIWTTTALNACLDFHHLLRQAFGGSNGKRATRALKPGGSAGPSNVRQLLHRARGFSRAISRRRRCDMSSWPASTAGR